MSWTWLELRNGWQRGDVIYGEAQWRLDGSVVTLRGSLAPGANTDAFVLPTTLAPKCTVDWVSFGVGANWESILARVSITQQGVGRVHYSGVRPTRGVMLTGTYRID